MKALSITDTLAPLSAISEPSNNTYRVKQVARIIKHLREQLQSHEPTLAMPTASMIDGLLCNCPPELLQGRDWHRIIIAGMSYLQQRLIPRHSESNPLLNQKGEPLFPNNELFDEHDAYLFVSALLQLQQTLD